MPCSLVNWLSRSIVPSVLKIFNIQLSCVCFYLPSRVLNMAGSLIGFQWIWPLSSREGLLHPSQVAAPVVGPLLYICNGYSCTIMTVLSYVPVTLILSACDGINMHTDNAICQTQMKKGSSWMLCTWMVSTTVQHHFPDQNKCLNTFVMFVLNQM